tara:strand:- start:1223 stop:1966 length:744 start_codon:yes stop_codon:yes gene_type:complete
MKLILLRHGESQWNLENRFTGWKDVPLTQSGIIEAQYAAEKLIEMEIDFNSIYTSFLLRAIHTAEIVAKSLKFDHNEIIKDWRLNERHYGDLQGLNKSETASKYGEKQVHIWRRSFDTPPPMLQKDDSRYKEVENAYKRLNVSNAIKGESLKNVIDRLNPFWKKYYSNIMKIRGNHIIVAHSNSLRAIIKILDNLSDQEIMNVNIPTGIPLVYTFNQGNKIINKKYLINESELIKKQKIIENQGKKK